VITQLHLVAFKCFTEQSFSLGKLNLFAGVNGSGKSSIIQSLLCLRQSFEAGTLFPQDAPKRDVLKFNGRLVELGSAKDVFCTNSSSEYLVIQVDSERYSPAVIAKGKYDSSLSTNYDLELASDLTLAAQHKDLNLFSDCFNYLQAERLGPRKLFPVLPERQNVFDVGKSAEHAPFIVASDAKEKRVDNEALVLEDAEGNRLPFVKFQWIAWMKSIFPGFDAETLIDYSADYVRMAYALNKVVGSSQLAFSRPINTAFGVSYVLGIIVAGLVSQKNSVLLVENPEAHLHPAAQSRLGEFLGRVACGGVQVFAETHSEHVMNGMRRVVKQGLLGPKDLAVFFLSRDTDGQILATRVPVESNAEISVWPDGFFDQLDKDLQDLYALE
jgi:predicted ATPase